MTYPAATGLNFDELLRVLLDLVGQQRVALDGRRRAFDQLVRLLDRLPRVRAELVSPSHSPASSNAVFASTSTSSRCAIVLRMLAPSSVSPAASISTTRPRR